MNNAEEAIYRTARLVPAYFTITCSRTECEFTAKVGEDNSIEEIHTLFTNGWQAEVRNDKSSILCPRCARFSHVAVWMKPVERAAKED